MKFRKEYILTILLIFNFCDNNVNKIEPDNKIVLQKGKSLGTYSFVFSGEVKWVLESGFPVYVSIIRWKTKEEFGKLKVDDGNKISIQADLKPGYYSLISHIVRDEVKEVYKDFESYPIIIDSAGGLRGGFINIEHKRKFDIKSPSIDQTIDLNKNQPQLKWQPVKDADYYSINIEIYGYMGENNPDVIEKIKESRINNFEYTFLIKKPQKKYDKYSISWTMKAFSKSKKLIAEEWSSFMVSF